jgi:hypothetical protein
LFATNRLIVFSIICGWCLNITAHADNIEFLPPLEPTRIVFKLPTEVRRLTPRTAQTLQLEIFRIGERHSDVLVHLYADTQNNSPTAHLNLYFWRDKRFVCVQSFPVHRPKEYRAPHTAPTAEPLTRFQIHAVQWLDLKKKKQPIIAVRAPGYTGQDEGKIHLFVFTDGLTKPPQKQSFSYYDGHGSSQLIRFVVRKDQENVWLSDYHERTQGGPDYVEAHHTLYEWKGKRFAPASH